jgi:hypothetical protein
MSIEAWALVWKIVFFTGVFLFAILAVLVTFGGAKDVGKLIRKLKQDALNPDHSEPVSDED